MQSSTPSLSESCGKFRGRARPALRQGGGRGETQRACDEATALLDALGRDGDHEPTRLRAHATLWACGRQLGRFDTALAHCEACYAIDMQRAAVQVLARASASAPSAGDGQPAPAGASTTSGMPDDRAIEREISPLFD